MDDLEQLSQTIRACTGCALHQTRTHAVPGEGSPHARVMFIGEGPGYNEDQQGRPFVGQAGQLLTDLLAGIGIKREDVFITNMVKCRPPGNRDPYPGEIGACAGYLDAQVAAIKPDVVVPLGRHALAKWFPASTISQMRAKARRVGDVTIFPLYHPAAALHNGALRPEIERDFKRLGDLLAQLQRERDQAASPPTPQPAPQRQLSML